MALFKERVHPLDGDLYVEMKRDTLSLFWPKIMGKDPLTAKKSTKICLFLRIFAKYLAFARPRPWVYHIYVFERQYSNEHLSF